MNTFLKLATAVSALAILSGAAHADTIQAATNQTVEINGIAAAYCNISDPDASNLGTTGTTSISQGVKTTFNYGTNFMGSDGKGKELKGQVKYTVSANGACQFKLQSTNGGFKNMSNSNDQQGAAEPLPVKAYLGNSAPGTNSAWHDVTLGAANTDIPNATYNIPNTATPGTSNVYLAFDVPGTTALLNAGDYSETITLNITPSY